jgi:hypothetical protein
LRAVEEFFLHLWDEFDDLTGVCRHVATCMAAEVVAAAAPLLATVSGALLGVATALLVSHHHALLNVLS